MTLTAKEQITVRRVTPTIGAEITGIDLTDTSPENITQINDLLLEHGVLFFHDSMLETEQHLDLARSFGELSIYPLEKIMLKPEDEPQYLTDIIDHEDDPIKQGNWHTDVTWIDEPPKLGFLQAVDVPASGGDTLWADLYKAYDALSPVMQNFLEGITVNHRMSENLLHRIGRAACQEFVQKLLETFPTVQHPMVRTHPETGRKALFIGGEFMLSIEGMHDDESQWLIKWLKHHITNPNFHVRWSWTNGDFVIWDERCTNHKALNDHQPSYRHIRRCTVDGDKPFYLDN